MKKINRDITTLRLKKDKIATLTHHQMVSINGGTMQMTPVILGVIYATMWIYTKNHVGVASDATTKDK